MKRRAFLKKAGSIGILLGVSSLPFSAFASQDLIQLCILHTNDTHSRIEPFPLSDSKFPGMGGVVARKKLVEKERQIHKELLLFDSGDILQGTPYFNLFRGEIEIKSMNAMAYDATTVGNHDFDAGLNRYAELARMANFPVISSNLNFESTSLAKYAHPYKIFKKGRIKVGVFGLSMQLDGLVVPLLRGETQFMNPIQIANEKSDFLKNEMDCDLVICLSHLGFTSRFSGQANDQILAKESKYIDIILGGHTHDFLDTAVKMENQLGDQVLVCQAGHSGIKLGKIELWFEPENKKRKKQEVGGLSVLGA